MNRVVTDLPVSASRGYVLVTPRWLLLVWRGANLAMALAMVELSWHSWDAMPLGARVLVGVVAPALILGSLWPAPWRRMPKLCADERGLYFPCNDLLIARVGYTEERWLFVPWQHIHDIRETRETGNDARCVAFDVEANDAEKAAFFAHVAEPRDRPVRQDGMLAVAYGDWPPSHRRTVEALRSLKARGAPSDYGDA